MEPDKTTSIGAEIYNMLFREKQQLAQKMAGEQNFSLA
jgi:hypothetical protein